MFALVPSGLGFRVGCMSALGLRGLVVPHTISAFCNDLILKVILELLFF